MALSPVAQKLILKMRVRFGDAAADVLGQEIITAAVVEFLSTRQGPTIKEEDLRDLETQIRTKLTGGTPRKMTMTMEKKAQVEGDEWAKMYQYSCAKGAADDKAKAEALHLKQVALKKELDKQIKTHEQMKAQEREEAQRYFLAEQAALAEAEKKEQQKKELQASIIKKLGEERMEQLRDKEERRQRALLKVKQEEEELAARIAYETRNELEQEEEKMSVAKSQLKVFLSANEINKRVREEDKAKQATIDAYYMQAWEEKLNKQEGDRLRLLEKTKARQTLQAEAAAGREESKRWLDQAVIDKYYKEREDARDREEIERAARVKNNAKQAYNTLSVQMKEREQQKAYERKLEEQASKMVLDKVALDEQKEIERKAKIEAQKHQFKAELEAQMKANAQRRRIAPMTEVERKINTQILDKVYDFQMTGKLGA